MDFTRLFDIPYYQKELNPLADMLAAKEEGRWVIYDTEEVIDIINRLSYALLALDVQAKDNIAIISDNRPEWNFTDFAIQQCGAVSVPIYPTISDREYAYILNDAKIKYAFVDSAELFEKLQSIKNECPNFKQVFTFNKVDNADNWEDLLTDRKDLVEQLESRKSAIQENDLATILYTSGTTGNPKGVMLSHLNIISNLKATMSIVPFELGQRTFSFLPLSHIFERMVNYSYMAVGSPIYYASSLDNIAAELKEVKPYYFTAVPRLLEKVYENIMKAREDLSGFKKKLFDWSMRVANEYIETKKVTWQLKLARRLVFSKWKEALGGNVLGIVTGAAALNPRLGKLFEAAGITVREGYGLSETSPVISVNRFEPGGYKFGTVGLPIPGVEVKITDEGEICSKGPNTMLGYYNQPELTNEVINSEGWFHTGDIGVWDGDFLKITDRKKALFKTSGGKYVAPQVIENKLSELVEVDQIMVIGNNRKFVSALIVPNFEQIKKICIAHHIIPDDNWLCLEKEEIQKHFESIINEKNEFFSKTEKIKKFRLLPKEWTIEDGELTPSMKIKRKFVAEKNEELINSIYQ